MTVKAGCDHENMTTPFCSNCGHPSEEHILFGLLKHLERNVMLAKGHLASAQDWAQKEPDSGNAKSHLAHQELLVEKWNSWRDKLQALIDAQAKADVPDSQ